MAKAKVCPILQAGRMASSIGTRRESGVQGDVDFSATIHYDHAALCMGEDCEWFEHGCPAHWASKELRDFVHTLK